MQREGKQHKEGQLGFLERMLIGGVALAVIGDGVSDLFEGFDEDVFLQTAIHLTGDSAQIGAGGLMLYFAIKGRQMKIFL